MLHMKMSPIYLSCYGRGETGEGLGGVKRVGGERERELTYQFVIVSLINLHINRHHGAVKLHIILTYCMIVIIYLVEKVAMNTLHKRHTHNYK